MKLAQDLREAILLSAIQGKLTSKNSSDESVEAQIERLKIAKKEAGIKSKKDQLPLNSPFFEIPDSWAWTTLSKLGYLSGGKTPAMHDQDNWSSPDVNWFSSKDMKTKYLSDSLMKISYKGAEELQLFPLGTLVMVVRSGILKHTLPLCILTKEATINQDLRAFVLFDNDMSEYVYWMLKGLQPDIIQHYTKHVTTVDSLRLDEFFYQMPVPLPPKEEQRRIVARISVLLPSVDAYEAMEEELVTLKDQFPSDMRASILQAAIMGKLVEQRVEEGTGEELYKQIQAEKQSLIRSGKLKKEKPLPEITEDEIPFDIPENWKWVRIGSILHKLVDGAHRTPKYTISGVPFVSVRNISTGRLDLSDTKFISLEEHRELWKRCNPERNDILLSKVGTTGVPALVDTDEEFSLFVSVALLKFNTELIDNQFLVYAILTPDFQNQCREHTRGVGNKNWVIADIANTVFPLPPLAEQRRIVEKLNELLPLCDNLKD